MNAAVESARAGLDPFLIQQVQFLLRLTYVQAVTQVRGVIQLITS